MTVIPVVNGRLRTIPKGFMKGLEDLEIREDHLDYNIIIFSQNTKKSPGDLRIRAITQNSRKDHLLTLVRKTQGVTIIIIMIIIAASVT